MTEPTGQRSFDIVLFGATGFTGQLVAEYLGGEADAGTRWALAGRDGGRLRAVHDRLALPDAVAVLEVDATDPEALAAMVADTRVVCTTVGPYARLGTPLLEACARAGTHYCDLTGEVQWMARVFEQINPLAAATGARLVHCCGFDSIPFDLGVWTAQEAMQSRHGVYARKVIGRMGPTSGGLSGGTAASVLLMMEQATRDPEVRRILMDPYALYPKAVAPGVDGADQTGARWDDVFDSWTAPFLMAPCNTRVIRRSNALMGLPWGQDFSYEEALLVGSRAKALLIAGGLMTVMATAAAAPGRKLLSRVLPSPGEGPDAKTRERGFFEYFAHAHHPEDPEADIRVRVTGKRDPGYGATSRMLAQSALALAHDPLEVAGGIWTTASALNRHLIERLRRVDVRFDVIG